MATNVNSIVNGIAETHQEMIDLVENAKQKLLKVAFAGPELEWERIDQTEGLDVWKYSPKLPTGNTPGIARGEITVNASMLKTLRFCGDVRNNVPLDSFCKSTELIETVCPGLCVYRLIYSLPWPLSPRDMYILFKFELLDEKRAYTLYTTFASSKFPEVSSFVRADSFGGVVIVANDKNPELGCKIYSVSQADLKGYIPSSVVKAIITRRPYLLPTVRDVVENFENGHQGKYFILDEDSIPKLKQ